MAKIRVLGESPPPPRGDEEEQLRDLRDYITRLKDELEYLLTHLGADNMDSAMVESLKRIGWIADEANQTAGDVGTIQGQIADINTALAGKQDALTFDDAPVSGSANPVTSGGVYSSIASQVISVDFGTITSLPQYISNAAITAEHVVLAHELGTPGAQADDWTISTMDGFVIVYGEITGSTTLTLILGLPGTSIS